MLSARVTDLAQLVTDFARQHEHPRQQPVVDRANARLATLQAQLQQPAAQVELLTEQYAHIAANYKTLAELFLAPFSRGVMRRPDPDSAAHREDAGVVRPEPLGERRTRGRRLYYFVLANDVDTEAFAFTTRPRTHFKRAVARKPWH